MAYFGRKLQKPLQKPGAGAVSGRQVARTERAVEGVLGRGRGARRERVGHVLRAGRNERKSR